LDCFRFNNPCGNWNKGLVVSLFLLISLTHIACQKPTTGCFTYSPTKINKLTEVVFNASCSQNAGRFTWDFGDGTLLIETQDISISHQYLNSGYYKVTLNAQRKDGTVLAKSYPTSSQTITVD
jgi:PKD repeat protein